MNDIYDIIFERREPKIAAKQTSWKMIYDSFIGGEAYRKGRYLHQHPKEGARSYEERLKRAPYLNQISPIVQMLSGFLFYPPPIRKETAPVDYLYKHSGNRLPLDAFMKNVSGFSLMFTCAVLVDSPQFNSEEVRTRKQRQEAGLNPYCSMYLPFFIRDFCLDSKGDLEWIILDDSYVEKSNPMEPSITVDKYTLWTKDYFQQFTRKDGKTIIAEEKREYNLGFVPCKLVNWQDVDGDNVAESLLEDPAYLSQTIYNTASLLDEMLYIGTLRVLFYPCIDGELPKGLEVGGIGSLSAIPFDGSIGTPFFDEVSIDAVEGYLKVIEMYMAEILHKIGMDTDAAKEFVQSGKAKKLDLLKIKSLLLSGAQSMEALEKWVLSTAMAWENKAISPDDIDVKYNTDYDAADLETQLNSLSRFIYFPFTKLKRSVYKVLAQKGLSGDISQKEMEEILSEIDTADLEPKEFDMDTSVSEEKDTRNSLQDNSEE